MNRKALFRSMNGIDDALLARSEHTGKVSAWLRRVAAVACICLVLAGGYSAVKRYLPRENGGASGGGEGLTYMSYAGPVFPLNVQTPDAELSAAREICFDFAPYTSRTEQYETVENGETTSVSYEIYTPEVVVTDAYELTNHSEQEKTLTLLYPFAANLGSSAAVLPIITVNGEEQEAALHIGSYAEAFLEGKEAFTGGNLPKRGSWETYRALVEAGYASSAFDSYPEFHQRVIVYEIKDRYGKASETAAAPTLQMEFHIDAAKTTVLSYGFDSAAFDAKTGYCARGTHVPQPSNPDYGESAWLIVLGEDIGDYKLNAYADGACQKTLEHAGATVVRSETTLGTIFAAITDSYFRHEEAILYGEENKAMLQVISKEAFVGLTAELMYDYGLLPLAQAGPSFGSMLEEILSMTRNCSRVMYLRFSVTVPAGGTVLLSAEMVKQASMDYTGAYRNRNGYDMVTALGSALFFDEQTASISDTDSVEILRQNFGFDPEHGITSVALDLSEPHYYIEVRKKQ